MMTRTEAITRLCEIASGLKDLEGQATQLGVELTQVLEALQEEGGGQ